MKYYGTKNEQDYGFYLETFEGAVDVEDAVWEALIAEQSDGKTIQPNEQGYPVAVLIEPTLEDLKTAKLNEIKAAFDNEIEKTGHLTSSVDSFEVDARRVDYANISGMVEYYTEPITYKGYTTDRPNTTLEELQVIRGEIFTAGVALYNKKWALEAQVNTVQTVAEVQAIHWNEEENFNQQKGIEMDEEKIAKEKVVEEMEATKPTKATKATEQTEAEAAAEEQPAEQADEEEPVEEAILR